jgi:exonuclease VII large subunit
MINRFTRTIIILTLITAVAACTFKTVYNRLDYLIPEYIEGMVTLDDVLEEKLEQSTLVLLEWHRNTQLKQYADWLSALQRDMATQLTEQQLEQRITEMDRFWRSLSAKVNDEMADLLPLLNKEQQNELFMNIEDSNDEFREEFVDLTEEQRIEDYAERISDTYQSWIGELTDEQQRKVEQAATELVSTAELRLQRRLQWQRGIREILAEEETAQNKSGRLRQFLSGFEDIDDETMEEKSAINRGVIVRLTVQISNSMTEDQQAHFISKTNDYIRMLTELAENR